MSKTAYTINQVASHFGITKPTLIRWMKEDGFPSQGKEDHDLDLIHEWLLDNHKKFTEPDPDAVPCDLNEQKIKADIKLKEGKIRLQDLELAVEQGRLILARDAVEATMRQATEIKTVLLGIPRTKCYSFVGLQSNGEAEQQLQKLVDHVLKTLSGADMTGEDDQLRKLVDKVLNTLSKGEK